MNDLRDPSATNGNGASPVHLAAEAPRVGLPRPLSSLVGRETELAETESRLVPGAVRLLTLTGPGGVGKTRVALEIGHRLVHHYRDGVRFVPLTLVRNPGQVVPAIGRAIGLRRSTTIEPSEIIGELRNAHMLLILDNFEHVLEAAIAVTEILISCPGVTALVTSRSILRISGEHVYPVPPMEVHSPTDPPDVILASDAARLFIDRARAGGGRVTGTPANAATIAVICERLEGMPLAIELAAAHANTLSLNEMLDRLGTRLPILMKGPRDQPERLQTMRAAIAWGYELLTSRERQMLRRLAVFEGGFGLEIVEALFRVEMHPETSMSDALELLERLVSQSFVRHIITAHGVSRYLILETVREFALAQISASGEDETVQEVRLAACLAFARIGATHLIRDVDPRWLDRFELEHLTILGALRWGFASPSPHAQRQAVQLAGHLWLFWYYHGHFTEARRWLELAIRASVDVPNADRANAFLGFGTILHYQGKMEYAGVALDQALIHAHAAGDSHLVAYVLTALGNRAEDMGRYGEANDHFNEARALFQEANDQVNVSVTVYHLGVVAYGLGDLDLASERLQTALSLSRKSNDPWSMSAALGWIGLVRCVQGDLDGAATALLEAMEIMLRIGSPERIAELLRRTALLADSRGDHRNALQLLASADSLCERLGTQPELPESAVYDRARESIRRRLPAKVHAEAWAAGLKMAQAEAVALAREILTRPVGQTPATIPRPTDPGVALSDREQEVLKLIADGKTDAEIAEILFISRRTAATHARHIYEKLGVTSRAGAAAWAVRHGLA